MKAPSPEKILESARRRVERCERKRYSNLFLGIGLSAFSIGYFLIPLDNLETYLQLPESFAWGFCIGMLINMVPSYGVMCLLYYARKTYNECVLSRRLIELEEYKIGESKTSR